MRDELRAAVAVSRVGTRQQDGIERGGRRRALDAAGGERGRGVARAVDAGLREAAVIRGERRVEPEPAFERGEQARRVGEQGVRVEVVEAARMPRGEPGQRREAVDVVAGRAFGRGVEVVAVFLREQRDDARQRRRGRTQRKEQRGVGELGQRQVQRVVVVQQLVEQQAAGWA